MVTETAVKVDGPSQEIPQGEGQQTPQPVAQERTPETLQAELDTLTQKRDTIKAEVERLTKEAGGLGERDKGLARLAREKQALTNEIADIKDRFEALRLSVHGTEEIPQEELTGNAAYEAEYQRRIAARQPAQGAPPPYTAEQVEAAGQLKAIARLHGIDYGALPPELTKVSDEMTKLFFGGQPDEAVETWEKGIKAYVADKEGQEKAKKQKDIELSEREARLMARDKSSSSGGGSEDLSNLTARQLARMAYKNN